MNERLGNLGLALTRLALVAVFVAGLIVAFHCGRECAIAEMELERTRQEYEQVYEEYVRLADELDLAMERVESERIDVFTWTID